MSRSVTVVVTLADGSNHTAGVEINTGNHHWSKSEPGGANNVFITNNGNYRVLGSSTELLRSAGGLRVGRFDNLDPASVKNKASGQGLTDDQGSAVTWKVDGIIEK